MGRRCQLDSQSDEECANDAYFLYVSESLLFNRTHTENTNPTYPNDGVSWIHRVTKSVRTKRTPCT